MSILFLVFLAFPFLNGILQLVPPSVVEKRRLARRPVFLPESPWEYPAAFTRFYDDHLNFRGQLIYFNAWLKYKAFRVPSTPRVLIGKEGWLFLDRMPMQPGTVEYYRSARLFSRSELAEWARLLEERRRWSAARGIEYIFFIVPNKNSIYPEYMPSRIRRIHRRSRMDQLLEYLRRHAPELVVPDLRPALSAAKKQYPVYPRTDTHWNAYGAYIGYRELMRVISERFPAFRDAEPLPLSRFKMETTNRFGCDLAEMLTLQEGVLREDMLELRAEPRLTAETGSLPNLSRLVSQGFSRCSKAGLPNVLMIHDSCFTRLRPYLSETFSRVRYIWDWGRGFFPSAIEEERPKLIIDQMAERFLLDRFPINDKL